MIDLKKLIESESEKQVKALARMEGKLSKEAVRLQKELWATIRDRFLDSLARDENGNIIYSQSNIARVNNMVDTYEYFRDRNFQPAVLEFGKDLMSIVDVEAGYYNALGKAFDFDVTFDNIRQILSKQIGITLEGQPSIITGSYLDRLLKNTQVQDRVANIVLENVSARSSFTKLKQDLNAAINGAEGVNGAMEKYLRTYAYDTFSQVHATIGYNMAETYGMTCFVYAGSLIKDSRDFCIEHLNEVMCPEQIEEYEQADWAGKNWDTPFVISLGGYNCKHEAYWIPDEGKEWFESEEQKKLNEEYIRDFKERTGKK